MSFISFEKRLQTKQKARPSRAFQFVQSQLLLCLGGIFYLQVVLDGEHSGNFIGANSCFVFVSLVADHAFQIHMAALHDDVDWRQ